MSHDVHHQLGREQFVAEDFFVVLETAVLQPLRGDGQRLLELIGPELLPHFGGQLVVLDVVLEVLHHLQPK